MLVAPRRALGFKAEPGGLVRVVVYVLGARQLAEAGILAVGAGRAAPRWAIALDVVHAASMLPVAFACPGLRGEALRSASAAGLLAALTGFAR